MRDGTNLLQNMAYAKHHPNHPLKGQGIPKMDSKIKFHKSWIAECEAAEAIRKELGLQRALDYLIGEKLFKFVQTSEREPRFAAELPLFIDEIRTIFNAQEISRYLDDLEQTKFLAPPEPEGAEDDLLHNPVWGAQEILRFARVKELLQAGPNRVFGGRKRSKT